MAMIVNKMLRVFPKKQKITEVDCFAICAHLADTGGELWEKVIYYVNEEENCLDIKYKSRKGRGDLGIEDKLDEFDIWIIENGEGGHDYLHFLNDRQYDMKMSNDLVNLYCFDEIRVLGNHNELIKDFHNHFFHTTGYQFAGAFEKIKQNVLSFHVNGVYNAGTIYDVGEEFSRVPELMTKEAFFKPRRVSYLEAEFLFLENGSYEIQKMLNSCLKDKFKGFEWNREHLHEIQICYNNRVVKRIETGEHWQYYNGEFFDNTVERNWIDYLSLRRRGLV